MTHEEWMKRQKLKWNPYCYQLDPRMWDVIRIKCMYKSFLGDIMDVEVLMNLVHR